MVNLLFRSILERKSIEKTVRHNTKNENRSLLLMVAMLVLFAVFPRESEGSDSSDIPNECEVRGSAQGQDCSSIKECGKDSSDDNLATLCVKGGMGIDGNCQIPCETTADDGGTVKTPYLCSIGETCTPGKDLDGHEHFYCNPSSFSVDINLVDMSIRYFVEGIHPSTSVSDPCSYMKNLEKLLDQNGDSEFDIFDVDLCIKTFINKERCDTDKPVCDNGHASCIVNSDCGEGLYCETDINQCTRECGLIIDRASGVELDRVCSGWSEKCNTEKGRCEKVDFTKMSCQIDRDCPNGSYCFLGECSQKCFRSIDCLSDKWYCNINNKCQPIPAKINDSDSENLPSDYAISFAWGTTRLDKVNDEVEIPLLIMNLMTKARVVDDDSLAFGYRLSISEKDYRKESQLCTSSESDLIEAEKTEEQITAIKMDCGLVRVNQFVTMENPYGVIYGSSVPKIKLKLDKVALSNLTTGIYSADLHAYFNNGSHSTIRVIVEKKDKSGQYIGIVKIADDSGRNHIADVPINMMLQVNETENPRIVEWDYLLEENGVDKTKDFTDTTSGYLVEGYIDGNNNLIFNRPDAVSENENKILVKGIYSPKYKELRLISAIDIDKDQTFSTSDGLKIKNHFGRNIRRIIEFRGNYDDAADRYQGYYRETVHGLFPDHSETYDGSFVMSRFDSYGAMEIPEGDLVKDRDRGFFPEISEMEKDLDAIINDENICQNGDASDVPSEENSYQDYIDGLFDDCIHKKNDVYYVYDNYYDECTTKPILEASRYGDVIKSAIETLEAPNAGSGGVDTNPISEDTKLSFYDYLKSEVKACESDDQKKCVNTKKLKCGLAIYRKALLNGWHCNEYVVKEIVKEDGTKEEVTTNICKVGDAYYSMFCDINKSPKYARECLNDVPGQYSKTMISLLEHNLFMKDYVSSNIFTAIGHLNDALFNVYKSSNTALSLDEAFDEKFASIKLASDKYEELITFLFSPITVKIFFDWPMDHFNGRGDAWLNQIENLLSDRERTMAEYIDMKRRVLEKENSEDTLIVQNFYQYEYLNQLYMIGLGKRWKGASYVYTGKGARRMDNGVLVLAKTQSHVNPLGVVPNRIYFENSDKTLQNYEKFVQRVEKKIENVETKLTSLLITLKGNAEKEMSATEALLDQKQRTEAELERLCGIEEAYEGIEEDEGVSDDNYRYEPIPEECTLESSEKEYITGEAEFSGEEINGYDFMCDDDNCEDIALVAEVKDKNDLKMQCAITDEKPEIIVNGKHRFCYRGEMGSILQEITLTEIKVGHVVRKMENYLEQIELKREYIHSVVKDNVDFDSDMKDLEEKLKMAGGILAAAGSTAAVAHALASGIASKGLGAASFGTAGAANVTAAVQRGLMGKYQREMGAKVRNHGLDTEQRRLVYELNSMVINLDDYMMEYEVATQQLFNYRLRAADIYNLAQNMVDRAQQKTVSLVERIVGTDQMSFSLDDYNVHEYNADFNDLIMELYKMVQAYKHRYNILSEGEVDEANEHTVYKLARISDVVAFKDALVEWGDEYCTTDNSDCDADNNREVATISLQKLLFPNLKNIIDPKTGNELKVGTQFHNIITSSEYKKKRPIKDASGYTTQIEIPFSIWPYFNKEQENITPMVADRCNEIIAPDPSGEKGNATIAVNILGKGVGTSKNPSLETANSISVRMERGDTDLIRSCDPNPDPYARSSKIYQYVVGYSPNNILSREDTMYHSEASFSACKRVSAGDMGEASCWAWFARNRSVASADWKLVITDLDGKNHKWLFEPIPENIDEYPEIWDIEIYIPYAYKTRQP